MPFLVDSVMGELNHRGLETYLLVHPVFASPATPPASSSVSATASTPRPLRESIIQVHVDRIDDEAATVRARRGACRRRLRRAPRGAGLALDARSRRRHHRRAQDRPAALAEDDVAETIAFLEWLKDNNFTFLGVREYRLEADGAALAAIPSSTLGVLRGNQGEPGTVGSGRIEMSPPAKAAFEERRLMLITNTSARSRVHRRVPMDMIGIKHFARRQAVGRSADRRSVHLDRLYPLDPQHPVSPPQGRRRACTRRVYAGQPFRQDARERARHLSPRRVVPDRRGHARPFRADHPAAQRDGRGCGCSPASTFTSDSPRSSSTCRASPMAAARAP